MSAFADTERVILELAGQCRSSDNCRLPSLDSLAQLSGHCRRTVASVVRDLKRRGVLFSRPGAGLYARPPEAPRPPAALPRLSATQRARQVLTQDILTGRYDGQGALPPLDTLCDRCGSGSRAVRQALAELAHDGLLRRQRRRLLLASTTARPHSCLALVLRSDERGDLGGGTPRAYTMLRELEDACRQRGLRLEIVGFSYTGEAAFYRHLAELERRASPLGYLFWTVAVAAGGSLEQPRRIVTRLAEYGKPIAVLRETTPTFALHEWAPGVPAALFALACSARDGELMGRYLLRLGRRPVTILVEEEDGDSGPARIEGITAVYRRAGLEHLVQVERLATRRTPGRTGEEAREWAVRNAGRIPSDVMAFMRNLSGLSATALREAGVERAYEPHYARLLASRGEGVWVAVTDPLALGALRFLSDQGVDVPGRIAVAGFDDSPSAFLRGLTSYNFATRQIITMMVNHVLMPGHTPRPAAGEVMLDGFVSERASTAGARHGERVTAVRAPGGRHAESTALGQ